MQQAIPTGHGICVEKIDISISSVWLLNWIEHWPWTTSEGIKRVLFFFGEQEKGIDKKKSSCENKKGAKNKRIRITLQAKLFLSFFWKKDLDPMPLILRL